MSAFTPSLNPNIGNQNFYHKLAAAGTNGALVKTGVTSVGSINIINAAASARYVKLYNKATAPVVGTDVPVKTFMVPASATISPELGAAGLRFSLGLGVAITGGLVDTDTTAVTANDVCLDLTYA